MGKITPEEALRIVSRESDIRIYECLEGRISELEQLLLTTTPNEERIPEARAIVTRYTREYEELEQSLADCESDYCMQVDKAVELHKEVKQLRAALASLEVDNHYWSTRPCQTCREISEVLGRPYGCYVKAGQAPKAKE